MTEKWKYTAAAALIGLGIGLGAGVFAAEKVLEEDYSRQIARKESEMNSISGLAVTRLVIAQGDIFWMVSEKLPDAMEDETAMAELEGFLEGVSNFDLWLGLTNTLRGCSEETEEALDPLVDRFWEINQLLTDDLGDRPPEKLGSVREHCENLYQMLYGQQSKNAETLYEYVSSDTVTDMECTELISEIDRELRLLEEVLEH